MKWGRQRNFKKTKERQAIINFRVVFSAGLGIPYNFIFGGNNSLNKASVKAYNKIVETYKLMDRVITKDLPRKLKKKLRRQYDV